MMVFQSWGDAFTTSFLSVGRGVVAFVPTLFLAIVIFAIGWILAVLIERIVENTFRSFRVDSALKSAGLDDVVKRSGHTLNSGLFVGSLVKWFVIVVFLIASLDVLGLNQVNLFLSQVVAYLPQVIVAVIILMVSAVLGRTMERIVVASSKASHVHSAEFLGRLTRWSIWIFALLAALVTLGIAPSLIQLVVSAILAGFALAIGLAFGLGGKEVAQRWIDKTTNKMFD